MERNRTMRGRGGGLDLQREGVVLKTHSWETREFRGSRSPDSDLYLINNKTWSSPLVQTLACFIVSRIGRIPH